LVGLYEKFKQLTLDDQILTGMIIEKGNEAYNFNLLSQRSIIVANVSVGKTEIQIFFLSELKNYKVTEDAGMLHFDIRFSNGAYVSGSISGVKNQWVKNYFVLLPKLLTSFKTRFEPPRTEELPSAPLGFVDNEQTSNVKSGEEGLPRGPAIQRGSSQ
jgi:hypothetical protein